MPQQQGKLVHCIVEKGNGHFPVAAVSFKDIAAVVSDWEGTGEEKLEEWLKWFQKVNIEILKEYDMVPLRFGVIADDEELVRDFLAVGYLPIKRALDKVRGRAEYLVQVGCDLKAMLRKIAEERKIAKEAAWPDRLETIEIGKALFEAAQAKKKALTEAVHQKLCSVSVDSSQGKCAD